MKNVFALLLLLAMASSAWALGFVPIENPYRFNNCIDWCPLAGIDGWTTWGGDAGGSGDVVISNGVCTINTNSYELVFNHDNAFVDMPGPPIPGVDNIEIIIKVVDIVGVAIIKLETYLVDTYGQTVVARTDAWDPETKITGPGVYSFSTAEKGGPIPAGTFAATPVFGVAGTDALLVVDWIWIGKAGTFPYAPCPYEIVGDIDADCMVTINDLALMAANWLIDCIDDPTNPACVTL